MMECCGKVITTRYCPDCGAETLSVMEGLLRHVESNARASRNRAEARKTMVAALEDSEDLAERSASFLQYIERHEKLTIKWEERARELKKLMELQIEEKT